VVFDLDGTLVDTVETRIRAWLAVFAEEKIPADRDQVAVLIGSDGKRLAREVASRAGLQLDPRRTEAIDRRSGEIYSELNVDPQPLPGARKVFAVLSAAGVAAAIATSSRREQVGASIDALRLDEPPLIVDGSHVEHAKPAPDLLLRAAEELGRPPARCWYVGDSTHDMQAAVAAGMPAIGVPSGAVDAAALEAAGASVVIDDLSQLAHHFRMA
jgi:HAD superfamily hydrolase (TIGR01509 family)